MSIDTSEIGLRIYPDPILKQKAVPFSLPLPENIADVADAMLEIMYEHSGIGLAANQAGLLQRIIVFDLSEAGDEPEVLINPEIVHATKDKAKGEEGCLSLPGVNGHVSRHESVRVKGLDLDGQVVEHEASELLSAMFQHEIDHLDGILFIDRLGATGKMKIRRQLKEFEDSFSG